MPLHLHPSGPLAFPIIAMLSALVLFQLPPKAAAESFADFHSAHYVLERTDLDEDSISIFLERFFRVDEGCGCDEDDDDDDEADEGDEAAEDGAENRVKAEIEDPEVAAQRHLEFHRNYIQWLFDDFESVLPSGDDYHLRFIACGAKAPSGEDYLCLTGKEALRAVETFDELHYLYRNRVPALRSIAFERLDEVEALRRRVAELERELEAEKRKNR